MNQGMRPQMFNMQVCAVPVGSMAPQPLAQPGSRQVLLLLCCCSLLLPAALCCCSIWGRRWARSCPSAP